MITLVGAQLIIKVSGHQHQWLAGGYDGNTAFSKVASMVVTFWIVCFCAVCIIVLHFRCENTLQTA